MHTHTQLGLPRPPALSLPEPLGWRQRLSRAVAERLYRAAMRRKVLVEFDQMMAMPDHMLRDIGLTRDQIRADRHRFRHGGELPRYAR